MLNIGDAVDPHCLGAKKVFGEHQCNAAGERAGRDHDLRSLNQKQPQQLNSQDDEAEPIPSADIPKRIKTMPGHIVSVFRIDARVYDVQIFESRCEPL